MPRSHRASAARHRDAVPSGTEMIRPLLAVIEDPAFGTQGGLWPEVGTATICIPHAIRAPGRAEADNPARLERADTGEARSRRDDYQAAREGASFAAAVKARL